MVDYQVTVFDTQKRYRPVSAIVRLAENADSHEIKKKGITKICINRGWTLKELKGYYSAVKYRIYEG